MPASRIDKIILHACRRRSSKMLTNLDLADMETCVLQGITVEENRFAKSGVRVFDAGSAYFGRTRAAGKKIGWKDGVRAFYCIIKYSLAR